MKKECNDKHCPSHGSVRARGREFVGTVIESKMQKTVNVEWPRVRYVPRFERYESLRSRVKAHNPECVNAEKGDIVRIRECRPLSKTKNFVVVEKMGKNVTFMAREELMKEAAKPVKESAPAQEESA